MGSASLTALIAVIHLKSHTRDFSEQVSTQGAPPAPAVWTLLSSAVKTDDDAFTLSLSHRIRNWHRNRTPCLACVCSVCRLP